MEERPDWFTRTLMRVLVVVTVLCLIVGGGLALWAPSEAWSSWGFGLAAVAGIFGPIYIAATWIIGRFT